MLRKIAEQREALLDLGLGNEVESHDFTQERHLQIGRFQLPSGKLCRWRRGPKPNYLCKPAIKSTIDDNNPLSGELNTRKGELHVNSFRLLLP